MLPEETIEILPAPGAAAQQAAQAPAPMMQAQGSSPASAAAAASAKQPPAPVTTTGRGTCAWRGVARFLSSPGDERGNNGAVLTPLGATTWFVRAATP